MPGYFRICMIYVVENGDNIDKIAKKFEVNTDDIIYDNQLVYPYELAIGQALYLEEKEPDHLRKITVNGYAYPYISAWVLKQTLPSLSELSIFSYGFSNDGRLIFPWADDKWMIEYADESETSPILTLTPFGLDGQFNNWLIHQLVTSEAAKKMLIDELLFTLKKQGFRGVDVDFEYILAEDRDAFSTFVEELAGALHETGYLISIALAPKTSADQKGLLYEGKDYKRLGQAVDSVLLMTYEWGYKYGPPMAVAPLHLVKKVVDYAVTEIPVEKINLGIPNYGYDWPLPYERGVTQATTIGNVEAVRIAIENGAEILFDETAKSPYFSYEKDGVAHEVWFEDVRSMKAKFELMNEYHLRGAGYWQIMDLFRANWLQLRQMFDIIKNS